MATSVQNLKSLALAILDIFRDVFVVHKLGLNMIKLSNKSKDSSFTHYKDMKGNAKCTN